MLRSRWLLGTLIVSMSCWAALKSSVAQVGSAYAIELQYASTFDGMPRTYPKGYMVALLEGKVLYKPCCGLRKVGLAFGDPPNGPSTDANPIRQATLLGELRGGLARERSAERSSSERVYRIQSEQKFDFAWAGKPNADGKGGVERVDLTVRLNPTSCEVVRVSIEAGRTEHGQDVVPLEALRITSRKCTKIRLQDFESADDKVEP